MSYHEQSVNKSIDNPRNVREEDNLDIQAILHFTNQHLPYLQGIPQLKQFSGGASNRTYQLDFENESVILRCPPKGTKAKSAHDMQREFDVMKQLKPVFPFVPNMLAFCNDHGIIGCDFYIMQKIKGIIPRANMPKGLTYSATDLQQLCYNVIDQLVALHSIDIHEHGLDKFGKGAGYTERQIKGWCDRFVKAKTWNVPACKKVMYWLQQNIPADEKICFIHNDFRLDNIVFSAEKPTEIIGILDWEMATVGNPLMDLGNSLAYWVQADDNWFYKKMRRQPTHLPGMLTRKELVEYYCKKANIDITDFRFYEVYGLFRLAVIVQQIYYRYHHKQTNNKAFKNFWLMVHYLNWRCKQIIK